MPEVCRWSFSKILTNYDGLELGSLLTQYEAPPDGSFRTEIENMKICLFSMLNMASFMTYMAHEIILALL